MSFKSFAEWPAGTPGLPSGNITTDTHPTKEQAEGVCTLLRRHGFGGDGKVFPVRVWVEEEAPAGSVGVSLHDIKATQMHVASIEPTGDTDALGRVGTWRREPQPFLKRGPEIKTIEQAKIALKPNLSRTMRRAIEYAKAHDRKLKRSTGGFWADGKAVSAQGFRGEWWSYGTVQALVARGFARYTDHRTNRNGQFPVEVTLTELAEIV